MNQHSSRKGKYYSPLIGAALISASLFHFPFPVLAAGTDPGTTLRNTATGNYEDETGNPYNIESNIVEVTVAKVAGITNQPSGFTFDNTSDPANTELSTGDIAYFEFTITNVGNDAANIFIPSFTQIPTKGLDRASLKLETSNTNPGTTPVFTDQGNSSIVIQDVPVNGKIIVKVTANVSATAANAPIEVLLGNTGSNSDANNPVADTQNQPDIVAGGDAGGELDDIRTEDPTNSAFSTAPALVGGQKEASALQQQFLGSNPLAMTRIEKTRGAVNDNKTLDNLSDDIISYSLELEVLTTTPNSFYTPADLEGRDYTPDPANPNSATFAGIADITNLILISDAIPANTKLAANLTPKGSWTPVYTIETGLADEVSWTTTAPIDQTERDAVTRVGWVYDARSKADGGSEPIAKGTVINAATGGFNFNVVTSNLTTTGGTIANIAQVYGGSVGGNEIFDESGDQDPSAGG